MATYKGVPFIWHTTKAGSGETVTGVKLSLAWESQEGGNFKGVIGGLVGGGLMYSDVEEEVDRVGTLEGLVINGVMGGSDAPVKGATISGGLCLNEGDVKGVAASGVVNWSKGNVYGIAFAGIFNCVKKSVTGISFGGLYNRVMESVDGFSFSLGVNDIRGCLTGDFSFGGIANYIQGKARGMLVSLGGNRVDGTFEGLSLGGVSNHAYCNGEGVVQIGLVNHITEYVDNGYPVIQIGLYNHIGNREVPILNVMGLKQFFKRKEKQTNCSRME